MAKARKTYSIKNFRGLDKENKPLKVASFRASDGQNFKIDSETLKTRPAFKHTEDTLIDFEEGEAIIDWYEYGVVKIVITTKHIYIQSGSTLLNEKSSITTTFKRSDFPTLDFTGKNPIFKEEKEVLFIFGLENIYVFSVINSDAFILYDLESKPSNPFQIAGDYYDDYDELPIPYVPTLFIGKNFLDDVNLLSNKSRYKIFAEKTEKSDGSRIKYYLPTHYDPSKHGDIKDFSVKFYDNKYKENDFYAVFLGKETENFTVLDSSYGTVLNPSAEIEIYDVFTPKVDFEYYGASNDFGNATVITEILGLDKNTFFDFTIKDNQKNMFEYIMDYIELNSSSWLENKVLKFNLNVKAVVIFKDATNDFIKERLVLDFVVDIYIQLKKYEVVTMALDDEIVYSSAKIQEKVLTDPYPAYPTIPTETFDQDYTLPNIPIKKAGYTNNDFKSLCQAYVTGQKGSLAHDDRVKVKGQYYEDVVIDTDESMTIDTPETYEFSEAVNGTQGNYAGAPAFPAFSNPLGLQVIEPGYFYNTMGEEIPYGEPTFQEELELFILLEIDLLTGDSGDAFAKIKVESAYVEEGTGITRYKQQAIIVPLSFIKQVDRTDESRQSFVYTVTINRDERIIDENLYTYEFNEKEHSFEFGVKDYFYDYKDEPSIEVTIEFQNNPDFLKISNNTFGINFGSENRLFLAGDPNYPNIDRYNVSNDLLGNNDKSQSYELTYFPSKNYRVLGGKGAINGYVMATDSHLYITKSEYRGDDKLFIRERRMDDNGLVGYNEHKTNIKETPLNYKSIVRFNNDILMLTKNGLFAIEITSNVLTNERLIKLRSDFVNTDLKAEIKNDTSNNIYIVENNLYLYIFIGTTVYVADSRYMATSEETEVSEVSYEIVKWQLPFGFKTAKFVETDLLLLEENGKYFFEEEIHAYDDIITKHTNAITMSDISNVDHKGLSGFLLTAELDSILTSPQNVSIKLEEGYKYQAELTTHFTFSNDIVTVVDDTKFADIIDGDTLYLKDGSNVFHAFVVSGFEASDRTTFTIPPATLGLKTIIYTNISNVPLYVSLVFDYDIEPNGTYVKYIRLTKYRPTTVAILSKEGAESGSEYLIRLDEALNECDDYYFATPSLKDCVVNKEEFIKVIWYSSISSLGSNIFEKTMFRVNFYATKQDKTNIMKFGYKTARRLKTIDDTSESLIERQFNLPKVFNFEEMDFVNFAMNTFNEMGMSLPLKENNFLHIQFVIYAEGLIELNGIDIIYKNNRKLKTIG